MSIDDERQDDNEAAIATPAYLELAGSASAPFGNRFSGEAAWSCLSAEQQAAIGAVALELGIAWLGIERHVPPGILEYPAWDAATADGSAVPAEENPWRPFEEADERLTPMLRALVAEVVPAAVRSEPVCAVPSLIGRVCKICGCSDYDPCIEICGWARPDVCTSCEQPAAPEARAGQAG